MIHRNHEKKALTFLSFVTVNIILITLMIIFGPVVREEITVDRDDFGRPTDM